VEDAQFLFLFLIDLVFLFDFEFFILVVCFLDLFLSFLVGFVVDEYDGLLFTCSKTTRCCLGDEDDEDEGLANLLT